MHDEIDTGFSADKLQVHQVCSADTDLRMQETSGIETLSGVSHAQNASRALNAQGRSSGLVHPRGDLSVTPRAATSSPPSDEPPGSHLFVETDFDANADFLDTSAEELTAKSWRIENLFSKAKQDMRTVASKTGRGIASFAVNAADPGQERDSDAQDLADAYNTPHRTRQKLSRHARRQINRQDRNLRKATTRLSAQRAQGHTLRTSRAQRQVNRAQRKMGRWQKVKKASSLKSMGGFFLKAVIPVVALLLLMLFMLIALAMCATLGNTNKGSWTDLNANENAVALYLLTKGMDETHVAAIMGNIQGESGFDTGSVEVANGIGHGLCQWSYGRWSQLQVYAVEQGRAWTDVRLQMDFFWKEYCNAPLEKSFASYQWSEDIYTGESYNHKQFEAEGDLRECTVRFRAHFERASAEAANDAGRFKNAQRYYAIITSTPGGTGGLGQDYAKATPAQQSLVNAAYRTPYAGDNWCAAWVTNVYNTAGLPAPGGNACDMARAWWCSSTSRSDLKVGMVVAVESSPFGIGQTYGHVGIYIGDNKVMHNASASSANAPNGVTITELDIWCQQFEYNCKARWGWAVGHTLD